MLLSALECTREGCYAVFIEDADMWHVIEHARDADWLVDHNDVAYCPEHSPATGEIEHWVVGCLTCDFEEEYDSEEEAQNEYQFHECETDTFIWDPEKVRAKEARRKVRSAPRVQQPVTTAIQESLDRQRRVEEYAIRWLRVRNFFLFWKKVNLEGTDT